MCIRDSHRPTLPAHPLRPRRAIHRMTDIGPHRRGSIKRRTRGAGPGAYGPAMAPCVATGRIPIPARRAAPRPALPGRRGTRRALGLAVTAVMGAAGGACGPAPDAAGAGPIVLYVANALDGTVTRVDGERGRPLGPPVPAGPAPWQLVAGPAGRLLVLASVSDAHPSGGLRHVVPLATGAGTGGERWAVRPVRLDPEDGVSVLAHRLAGAGRWAVVAYDVRRGAAAPPPGAARLALIDLRSGGVVRTHPVATGTTAVLSLALGGDEAAPVAYLGLWDWVARRGRVLALQAATGAPLAAAPLAGAPEALTLGAAPGGAGARLYGVEAAPGPDGPAGGDAHAAAERWRVVGLDPLTLAPESEHGLAVAPLWFALAPDGDRGYALSGGDTSAGGRALLQLDLASGATRPLTAVPGRARELVASRDRLYALDAHGDRLWAFDRHTGRVVRTVPVGRRPIALTLEGS